MLIDISPALNSALPIWPGDEPLSREIQSDILAGAVTTSSTLRTTVHVGAHVDAPCHCVVDGASIDSVPLESYIGPCEVMRVNVLPEGAVTPELLPQRPTAPRVLIATDTFCPAGTFAADFAGLSVELADYLHECGVRLVGVDTPSVDRFADGELPVHRRLIAHGIAIVEGLTLREVPAGRYELIALPLRLEGFDASPVRAVLRTRDNVTT